MRLTFSLPFGRLGTQVPKHTPMQNVKGRVEKKIAAGFQWNAVIKHNRDSICDTLYVNIYMIRKHFGSFDFIIITIFPLFCVNTHIGTRAHIRKCNQIELSSWPSCYGNVIVVFFFLRANQWILCEIAIMYRYPSTHIHIYMKIII